MKAFNQIEGTKWKFRLSKMQWSEAERWTAHCIGLKELNHNSFVGDVRFLWPEAFHEFMKYCFPGTYTEQNVAFRLAIQNQIKMMYSAWFAEVKGRFENLIDYDRPMFVHQKSSVWRMLPHMVNILSFEQGLGKANTLETNILTESGYKKMRDIEVGERVFGSNGKLSNVTGIFPQGKKHVYRVHFSDGDSTDCDVDHLWIVINNTYLKKNQKREVISTRELIDNLITGTGRAKYSIPYTEPVEIKEQKTPIDPYLMGLLLGDGSFRKRIDFSTNDQDLIPVIKRLIPEKMLIKKSTSENYTYRIVDPKKKNENRLINIIKSLGLFDKLSHEKFIPNCFKWNSVNNRLSILQGLLDTDGHVNKSGNRVSYTTVSCSLAKDVKFLVNSLGGHCTIGTSVRKEKRDCYFLAIILPPQLNPFRLERRLKRYSSKTRTKRRNIVRIEKLSIKKEMQCISVDADDRSYLINNCIVTHNTLTSATLSKILDIPRTVIIAPAGVKWNWFHDLVDDWGFNPLEFTILDANPRKTRKAMIERYLITNYEQIEKHWEYLMEGQRGKVGHIIIDEIHYIKNHTTRRHKAVAALINAYPDARVTMLTGTPIPNRINDLFAYFKIANHPLGSNQAEFVRRYIKKSGGGKVIGAENLDELRARYSNVMIRKKTEECVDLPDLIEKKHYLDESEITDEYKRVLKEMYERHREREIQGENVKDMENQVTGNIHTLNKLLALVKAKLIIPIIDRLNEEGKKVVVFSTYKDALAHLENHYKHKCVKIDGSVGSHQRSQLIDRFTNSPSCMNFFGQNKAAGVGINLVNAQHLFFLNFTLTWDDIDQPKKRIHRLGQKGTCFINFMIVKNSIDEHIFNLFASKAEDASELLDKGKKGVVDYRSIGSVQNVVFKQLMKQFADEHGITTEAKFERV